MQNKNFSMCKSATWNSAIHKKSAKQKIVQHEKFTAQNSATWKWRITKKVQHEKSATRRVQHEKIKMAAMKYGKSTQE